ncbi:hypothetical protein [Lacrimispora sp.]|uniref:hypothetical protein n=1 Tax=Lacrimispora sp. TaxID=2719234 RepID=UPI0028A9162E|nr:hypothetical protein [Lacrimispora sp.]
MKFDNIKMFFQSLTESIKDGHSKARSNGLYKKLGMFLLGTIGIFLTIFFLIKMATYLFETITEFIQIHFFGVAATALGGIWLRLTYLEKRDKKKTEEQERALAKDRVKLKFSHGSFEKVRKFLFTQVLNESNFESLTGLYRPLNPAELGSPSTGSYIKDGLIFHQFRIPKTCLDDINVSLLNSVIQSIIDQKISVYGIFGIISPTHTNRSDILMISDISDMKTHVILTTVLSFNGEYSEQAAYDRAMIDSLNINTVERSLDDYDYHDNE